MFVDEKVFKGFDDSVKFVRKVRGGQSKNNYKYFKRNSHSCNVFGFITKNGKGNIYLAEKTHERSKETDKTVATTNPGGFNNASYCELMKEVTKDLLPHIRDKKLIYIQDNAAVHVAKNKKNEMYVQKEVFNKMNVNVELPEWPALSPDMNPIENVWSLLMKEYRKVLNNSRKPPRNPTQTFSLIKIAWNNLNNQHVANIFNSFEKKYVSFERN